VFPERRELSQVELAVLKRLADLADTFASGAILRDAA
jgi:hypothetical protein